jgi:putative MATE family efflux protein
MTAAFVMGISSGVQTIASRRVGEGHPELAGIPLNGGLVLAAGIALPWSLFLIYIAPEIFPLLIDDAGVVDVATPYFQVRSIGLVGLGLNFAFRGYWNGVDRSMLYMRTLVLMHVVNIFLNWVFIFGNLGAPELGATGAAVATVVATYLGAAYYFLLGWREARGSGFLEAWPGREVYRSLLTLSVPRGIQQTLFAAGLVVFSVIVGMIGTEQLAVHQVIVNILLVCVLPGVGFGLAGATLVSQELGRGQPEEAERWGWDVVKIGAVAITVIASPALIFPEVLLAGFVHDPDTLALGVAPLRVVALGITIDVVGVILMNAVIGAGATRTSAAVSILTQWLLFLPVAFIVGPVMGWGLTAVWIANMCYRVVQTGIFAVIWKRGAWKTIEV